MNRHVFPKQRNSTKAKLNEKWYKPCADYVVNICKSNKDIVEVETLINAVNGIYDENTFKYVLQPYGNSANEYLKDLTLPGAIRDTSLIKDLVNKKLGRFIINRPKFQVKVNNSDVILNYNKEFKKIVESYKMKLLTNALKQAEIDTGVPEISQEQLKELEDQIKNFKDDYLDERAIKGQDIIDAIWDWTNSEAKYWTAYWDWIVTGSCFMDREITNSTLYKENVRTNEVFYVDNGANNVDDFDMHYIIKKISYPTIIEKYGHLISTKDLEYLTNMAYESGDNGSRTISLSLVEDRYGYLYPDLERSTLDTNLTFSDGEGNVDMYYIRWKTEKPELIVTYVDEMGQVNERHEDESYKLNKEAGDISIEKVWIQQFFEVIRFGDERSGIYINPKYADIQRSEVSNYNTCKSTLTGKVGLFPHAPNPSIVKALMPFDILYKIYGFQIERIVSREVNNGRITMLPQSLLESDKISMDQNMYMLYADGKLIIDDSEDNAAIAAQMLKVTDHGMGRIIGEMINLRKSIKDEAWDNIGWNRQIDGEILASDGKANTNSAINIAAASGVLADEIFYKFMENDLNCDLDMSKVLFIEKQLGEALGSFKDSNGAVKMLELSGDIHANTEYGIFFVNTAREREKYNEYKNLAFAAGQQGDYEMSMAAIDGESALEIKRSLKEFTKLKQQAEQQQAKLDREHAIKLEQEANTRVKAELEFKYYKVDADNENDREVALIQAEAKMLDSETAITSKGDITDMQDASNARAEEARQTLEQRKQSHKERVDNEKLKLDREKLKSAERIAKMNKNQYDK